MSAALELLPEDIEYLHVTYRKQWLGLSEGNSKFGLLIEDFPVPKGILPATSNLMILIPVGYPGSPLDMFYFDPPLRKSNDMDIACVSTEMHFGRKWQRWSRHYQWSPGQDDLTRHIEYVRNELQNTVQQ